MANKIELVLENEKGEEEVKTFHQPARIKGKAARIGLKIGDKLENLENGIPGDDLIDEMLQYVAEYGYNNQFTADELENGIDARDLFETLSKQIASIVSRQGDGTGKPSKAKKA